VKALELKVPPPAVGLLAVLAMWGIARAVAPSFAWPASVRITALVALVLVGAAFTLVGAAAFRRVGTTVSPLKPQRASSLVTTGIYRFTRNPMYLGMVVALIGVAVYFATPWTLLGPVAFVLYMTRWQIVPEERALLALFGSDYTGYCGRVRRWI